MRDSETRQRRSGKVVHLAQIIALLIDFGPPQFSSDDKGRQRWWRKGRQHHLINSLLYFFFGRRWAVISHRVGSDITQGGQ